MKARLFVGNLDYSVTDQELHDLFSKWGKVSEAVVIEGKGFGFVQMSTPKEAEEAKNGLNGTEFKGRVLKVAEAKPKRNRRSRRY